VAQFWMFGFVKLLNGIYMMLLMICTFIMLLLFEVMADDIV